MDRSRTGKGILASLEHKTAEPARRSAMSAPSPARGALLLVACGVLAGALLAWWLASGPSPVIVRESLPPFVQAAPSRPEPAPAARSPAAIVDEAPVPPAAATMRRHANGPQPSSKPNAAARHVAAVHETHGAAAATGPDNDVALLSALVAHANERDVVEARAGDSTASLLQRCRRVGGEEGRLCRIRMCASRAGDEACHVE